MSTLYELTGEYLALLDMADEDDPAFVDTLESIQGEIEAKAESYAVVMKEMDATIKKYDEELARLSARKDALQNHVDYMKSRLLEGMEKIGLQEIRTDHFKLKVQKNGGKVPMRIIGDVPNNYQKVVLEPDKEMIRKDLEAGKKLNFAVLEERGKHLRIS